MCSFTHDFETGMAFLYVPQLLLAGLIGIHCEIVTVSEVSVKVGGSISIPCLYESRYRSNVKYLCKGEIWRGCTSVVKTTQSDNSGKYSISDDRNQRIFTVTINDLTNEDTLGQYWCAVEKSGWDVRKRFDLSIPPTGVPSLYVDQQAITAFEGGSVTVRCHYKGRGVKKWCRLGGRCVESQTGTIDGTRVAINKSVPNVFTVTMSGLRTESSNWYWCAKGNLQMPVHVTVTERPTTTTIATTIRSTTSSTFSTSIPTTGRTLETTTQHSPVLTSTEPHTAQPTNSTINGTDGESLQKGNKNHTIVAIFTPIFILLLLAVPAAFFGWRKVVKSNENKPEGPDINAGLQIGSDPDVHYATVVYNQHAAAQQKERFPEDSVTYSTIVEGRKESRPQMTEPVDGGVIYSTVILNKSSLAETMGGH